tara:strand:- start:4644 stop:5552 length:909 start_codon:yes stop_codon:yes gene_type:complete
MITERVIAIFLLFLCGIIFGLLFSINAIAVQGGVPAIAYAFWQSLGAGVLLLIYSSIRGNRLRFSFEHIRTYIMLGLLGMAFPLSILAYVAPKVPPGPLTLLLVLSPLLTYVFSVILRVESFRWLSVAGIVFGISGVALAVLPDTALPEPGMAAWMLLGVLAPVSFAAVNVLAGKFRPPASAGESLSAGLLLFSAIILVPVMFATDQLFAFDASMEVNLAVVWSIIINAVFWLAFFEIVRIAGPVFFAQFNFIAVICGIAWAYIVFGQVPSVYIWVSAALLFLGLGLVLSGNKKETRINTKS